ncbi:hypothetical protein AK830_g652 [Neonectria ditissima]|uniref:Uncharacterized protein n=1 Tax=Neonectria ditissima TaxID=78410 RepID=A0A0P7BWN2_9HYPO|nr:hypothetical protein AK830_g652 [Neonectria ditissima]
MNQPKSATDPTWMSNVLPGLHIATRFATLAILLTSRRMAFSQLPREPWVDSELGPGMNELLLSRWQEAIERSKSRLSEEDRQIAESFGTPEAILEDLQKRQEKVQNTWLGQILSQLCPFLKSLHSLSAMLVVAILPQSVEMSLAWGILSIILRLGLKTEERSRKMVETLNAVQKILIKVNRYAGGDLRNEEEVKEALVDIHAKLLEFWVNTVKELRKHPLVKVADAVPWNHIDGFLNSTIMDIQKHYESIRDLADSNITMANNMSFHQATLGSTMDFPVLLLPIPHNPDFFGREETIQRMHDHLDPSKRKLRLSCFTIYGMGGIGKTQVAASYAYRYCQNVEERSYDAVFWVASETKAAMRQSFSSIALALNLPGVTEKSDPSSVLPAVHIWLKQTDKRWLLIFDNAERWDDIMLEFWPQAGATGAVIITSRDFNLANSPASDGEELQTFTPDESSRFAKLILKDWDSDANEEQEALDVLLSKLDGLPLAIHQISSLINAEGSCVADFLEIYNEHADEFHQDRGGDHQAFYPHSLETVWLFAINALSRDVEAQLLLGAICLLSPDSIPEKLFHARNDLPLPPDAQFCYNPMKVRKTLRSIRSSGVISVSRSAIRIHRLLQSAFMKRVEPSIQDKVFWTTSVLLNDAFPKQNYGDPLYEQWEACSRYALHAQALSRNWRPASKEGHALRPSADFLQLVSHVAWYFRELSDFESASELVEIGLEAAGDQHEIITAHLLNTAGVVKELTYEYSLSREALQKSLDIRLRVLGADHLETNGVKTNLASIIAAQGQYDEALALYEEAEKASTGSSAQDKRLASCRYAANYGRCFTEMGEYTKARLNLVRSRDILNSGKDNPVYRRAIEYCFGNLNLAEQNFEDARVNYGECLTGYSKEILAKNTLLTCSCHYKLSLIEMRLGHQEAVLKHINDAMNLAQKINAQGYVGRILLVKSKLAQKGGLDRLALGESEEEIQLKINAVRDNLEAQMSDDDLSQTRISIFDYFIPWQAR